MTGIMGFNEAISALGDTVSMEPDGYGGALATTSVRKIWSDDFGDGAVDTSRWLVLPGGDANHGGSGTMTGITYSVGSSALTVNMNTTASDELWLMSNDTFSLPCDFTILLSKSQELAANQIWAEFVEVDTSTGLIYDNPALAGEPRNRISINAGSGTVATTTGLEAISDGTGSLSTVTVTTQTRAASAVVEYLLEARAEDTWLSSCPPDVTTARTLQGRLSTQTPNNSKLYKLRLRFKNNGAPATNTVVKVYRVLIADMQEQRVEVTSGRGDISGGKALPVNATLQANGTVLAGQFAPAIQAGLTSGSTLLCNHLVSAATTNATLVKSIAGRLVAGHATNTTASMKFVKFFTKASAPTPGTDTPFLTIGVPANSSVNLTEVFGMGGFNSTGFGYAITGAAADLDTTAVAAGDVVLSVIYI